MSSQKENTRNCCMCGSSPSKDSSISLYRFPKPGSKNALRCELWAKYCFPNDDWSSPKFQNELNSKHKMLCNKHFESTCFIEKKLFRTAVPGVQISTSEQPCSTNQELSDINVAEEWLEEDNMPRLGSEQSQYLPQPSPSPSPAVDHSDDESNESKDDIRRDGNVPRWMYDIEMRRIAVEERQAAAMEAMVEILRSIRNDIHSLVNR